MCLILFALEQHPEFPLVLAANRDEFYRRPTSPMHWWHDQEILAGRDQLSGGTWLGVTPSGIVTAVTNVREASQPPGAKSRGELPIKALTPDLDNLESRLCQDRMAYSGFNLVRLAGNSGWYFSNRDSHPGRHLHRGIYGVSNHLLQSPWPKLVKLRRELAQLLAPTAAPNADTLHNELLERLQDNTPAPDSMLPDTGVGIATERFLSSPFIASEDYGTRATTVVTINGTGEVRVTEQTWLERGRPGERLRFCWQKSSGQSD